MTMRRRRMKKALGAAVALASGAALMAFPASADCVSAEVAYQRPNQTKQYVVGPKQCLAPTPWGEFVSPFVEPAGEPSLIMVEGRVWVPLP